MLCVREVEINEKFINFVADKGNIERDWMEGITCLGTKKKLQNK